MLILVSYHGTAESNAALALAVNMAEVPGNKLVALVAHRHAPDDIRTDPEAASMLIDQLENLQIDFEVRHAPAGHEIADALLSTAKEISAELIVIGLSGRTTGRSVSIGRNAEQILLEANCPVLTTTSAFV